MRKPEGRTIGRTLLGTWLAAGVAAAGYGLLASGCTPVTPVVEPIVPAGEIDGLEKAEQAWRAETITEHEALWNEESGPDGDPFSAGLAAFNLASATRDPAWSNAAIDAFDKVIENDPGFALARAWRGSAHALMARDYPVKGLWQIIPGPGFVRLYHVKAAFSDLDSAVDAAPDESGHPAHPRIHLSCDAAGLRRRRRGPRGLRQAARLDPRSGQQSRTCGGPAFPELA